MRSIYLMNVGSTVAGRFGSYRNVYINAGHGTLGWTLACGSGKLCADIMKHDLQTGAATTHDSNVADTNGTSDDAGRVSITQVVTVSTKARAQLRAEAFAPQRFELW